MSFTIVEHKDRQEWLQWRHQGIGSSDVPVIMGVSRYKTYEELLHEKTQKNPKENKENSYIKERGNKIETIVREMYEKDMGLKFPSTNVKSDIHSWGIASLDGMDSNKNLIIEIKLLTSQNKFKFNPNTLGYLKWLAVKEGVIPEDYYPQIQHQLMITNLDICMFLGYNELRNEEPSYKQLAVTSVERNNEYIKNMIEKCEMFWKQVKENK